MIEFYSPENDILGIVSVLFDLTASLSMVSSFSRIILNTRQISTQKPIGFLNILQNFYLTEQWSSLLSSVFTFTSALFLRLSLLYDKESSIVGNKTHLIDRVIVYQ